MNSEPAAIIGVITAIVSALLVLMKSFGIDITDDQQKAIDGFVAVVAPLIAAAVIRFFVWPRASVQTAVDEAHRAGAVGQPPPQVG